MKKILAIDDQRDNLTTIVAVLKSQLKDIEVITAISGMEGIEKAKAQLPDTIILDVIMPTMDGFDTCIKLKEDNSTKHIPIIMLTAIKTDADSRAKGLLLGADAFLSKPIDPVELSAQTKVMLRIKDAEDKLRSEKSQLEKEVKARTQSLAESQDKYRALYENAPLSYQSLNGDGTFRDINPNWESTLGYSKEEVIGTYFGDYLHPDYQEKFPIRFKKFKKDGSVSGVQFKIKHKNGHYLDIEFEGCVGYNPDGSFKQTYCVFKDVTDSKDAQTKLVENEEYFRTLIENSSDFISIVDANGVVLRSSESDGDILGHKPDYLLGMSIFDFVHPDDSEKISTSFKELIKDNAVLSQIGFRFLHKDHTWRYLEGSGRNMLSHPRIKGIVLNYRDVTSLKLAENDKLESERKLSTLINNLQGIAYRCKNDSNWTMEYLSAGFEYMLGYKVEDVIANNTLSFNDLIHSEDHNHVFTIVNEAIQNKKSFEVQYRIKNKNGEYITVLDKGVGLFDNQENGIIIEGFITNITEYKKAEEEIIRLSSAVKQSPSVIAITNTKGIIEYVNPKFTELTGYTYDEALGVKSNVLKSGSQPKSVYTKLWNTITNGETWKGEFHNKKKDGSLFWEYASISPIFDKNGKIINYIKVAEDITHKKQSAKALQQSEQKYQKLIETSAEGFWLIDTKGITKDVNNALCKILGYSKEEIMGKTPYDFVDDENLKIFEEQISRANSDSQRAYEIYLRNKNGENIPTLFQATSMADSDGVFAGSFAFVTDISISKRSILIQKVIYNISNAVTQTENLNTLIEFIQHELDQIIDTKNFFIALYDKDKNTLSLPFFTDEKDKIVSLPSGKSMTDYIIRTKKPLLANRDVKDTLEAAGEIERYGSDSKVWLGVPLKIDNEVMGVLVVQSYEDENAYGLEDMKMLEFVSEQIGISINRKRIEEHMKYALKKANESDRLKTAFLQNISHEIRTPMNGIMGFTSLLKDSDLTGEEMESYIDVIMVSGKRMLNTLNDLMDMSMLETEQVKINTNEINLNDIFRSLHDFFKLEVTKKNMEIFYHNPVSDNEMLIISDREKISGVLSNLIKNSIKYSAEGRIDFGYKLKDDMIEVYVIDTGIGIPPDRLNAIFDRFVQADIEDVKVYEGSGLGLSISKAYIEMMGGSIWAESVEGEGSQFYFTIPYEVAKEKPNKQISISSSLPIEHNKLKILIVEDEEVASEYLSIILDDESNELLFAKNGVEGVEISKENPDIDLILMDIKLPIMDGYTATANIRSFNKDVVIIAQTAYALAGDREKAISAGCNDYITKPISKERLMELINNYMN